MYKKVTSWLMALGGLWLLLFLGATFSQHHTSAGLFLIAFFITMALSLQGYPLLKGYTFTLCIFAAATAGMYYPSHFITINGFALSKLIIPLLQIIMFGMGTALSWQDFARVLQMRKGVGVGLLCQYSIMPVVGWGLTKVFAFPPEIAAGIILVGCCPSGLASNVMSYLAKANLALSVTLTAIATILAPLLTPFFMRVLAGQYIAVDFWAMMWDIAKIVILPIGIGLIFHHLFQSKFKILETIMPLFSMGGIVFIIVIITSAGRNNLLAVGPLLLLAVLLHNSIGYFLGYWFSRFLRMSEKDCRTIALEVGLQNAGLASGLALAMGKLATMGLGPAVFGPLMNITGSSLALWWRSKPIETTE